MTSLPVPTDIIFGPPGCGKTKQLLSRVESVLERGVDPSRVGYYTFTRRAAEEARTRAMQKFSLKAADLPHFRTLHSESMRQMGISSAQVLEGEKLSDFSDWIGERVTGRFSMEEGLMSGYERGDRMLFMDNLARIRRIPLRQQYDEDHDELDWSAVERFSRGLREFKSTRALIDYTDMLELFVERGPRRLGLENIFFDEAQDMTAIQWAVASRLCDGGRQATVAGDDDQAIYRWAGADVEHLLQLEGRVSVLEQSYRVPAAVQRVANQIIGRVGRRMPKAWRPRESEGLVKFVTGAEEVDWSTKDDRGILVLARNQYLLIPVMRELRAAGYLFEYHGNSSVRPSILAGVVTWERLRQGDQQSVAAIRKMYSLMELDIGVKRGFKKLARATEDTMMSMEDLRREGGLLAPPDIWHKVLTNLSAEERQYMIRCRRHGERFSKPPRIRVGTIHDSKGSERSRVVLMTDMAPRTWNEMTEDVASECRVFYVGATRAIDELVVMRPRTSKFFEV